MDVTVRVRIELCVKRGIILLDRKEPRWREFVTIDALDFTRTHSTILGQVFNSYDYGVEFLGLKTKSKNHSLGVYYNKYTIYYGFSHTYYEWPMTVNPQVALTAAWINVLKEGKYGKEGDRVIRELPRADVALPALHKVG